MSQSPQKNIYDLYQNKNEIGKSKLGNPDLLVNPDHSFGYEKKKDIEGVKDIARSWVYHKQSETVAHEKDFLKMNQNSAKLGLPASKVKDFRQSNEIQKNRKEGTLAQDIYLPTENFFYGKPNKPSTPLNCVLSNAYGLEAEIQLEELYKQRAQETRPKMHVKNNKATLMRAELNTKKNEEKIAIENKKQFKLSKFTNIQAKTNSYNKNTKKVNIKAQEQKKDAKLK